MFLVTLLEIDMEITFYPLRKDEQLEQVKVCVTDVLDLLPLYSRKVASNYRPISLTSHACKP